MIREPQEVDFSMTGRTPSEREFAHISELIAARKAQLRKKGGSKAGAARKSAARIAKTLKASG